MTSTQGLSSYSLRGHRLHKFHGPFSKRLRFFRCRSELAAIYIHLHQVLIPFALLHRHHCCSNLWRSTHRAAVVTKVPYKQPSCMQPILQVQALAAAAMPVPASLHPTAAKPLQIQLSSATPLHSLSANKRMQTTAPIKAQPAQCALAPANKSGRQQEQPPLQQ